MGPQYFLRPRTPQRFAEHRLNTLFGNGALRCVSRADIAAATVAIDPQVRHAVGRFSESARRQITPHVDPAEVLIIFPVASARPRGFGAGRNRGNPSRREYPWGMVTNGMALTPQRLDRLMQAGLRVFPHQPRRIRAGHNHIHWQR